MTALIAATLILAFSLAFAARAGTPKLPGQTARTIVATWNCQDKIPQPRTRARSPWRPHSQGFRRAELARWQHRLHSCRKVLDRRAYEWNWQAWLPDKWARVARCETGINWHHGNSSYVSAFGISVQSYNDDADYMGVRHWYVKGKGSPSPWEQWQAALGHYRQHGGFDGWGCRNA